MTGFYHIPNKFDETLHNTKELGVSFYQYNQEHTEEKKNEQEIPKLLVQSWSKTKENNGEKRVRSERREQRSGL